MFTKNTNNNIKKIVSENETLIEFIKGNRESLNDKDKDEFLLSCIGSDNLSKKFEYQDHIVLQKELISFRNKIMYGTEEEKMEYLSIDCSL